MNMDVIDQCFCEHVTGLVPVFISHFRALTFYSFYLCFKEYKDISGSMLIHFLPELDEKINITFMSVQ